MGSAPHPCPLPASGAREKIKTRFTNHESPITVFGTNHQSLILIQQCPGAREHVVDHVCRHVFHEARSPFLECNNARLRAHDDALGCGTGAGQWHGKTLQPIDCSTLGDRRDEAQPEPVEFLDR